MLDLITTPSFQIQPCQSTTKQEHTHRFGNCGGFILEHDSVIPEVAVRVKTESDVVPCTDVGCERSELRRVECVSEVLGDVSAWACKIRTGALAHHVEATREQERVVTASWPKCVGADEVVVDAGRWNGVPGLIDYAGDLVVAVEAGVGTIEQADKQHVWVSVPVCNAFEGDLRADDGLTSETRDVVYLPGIRAVVIEIELLVSTCVVSFVSIIGCAIGVGSGSGRGKSKRVSQG